MDYDLIVIGAGSGGVRCARMAAGLGAKVAIVEDRYLGGTCVNVGCVPKKLYAYGSHFSEDFKLSADFGWQVEPPTFNWQTLRDNKTREISRLNGIYERLLTSQGVSLLWGRGSLLSPTSVQVGADTYSAKHILVATGGWPVLPDIPGAELCLTSNDIFDLATLPTRMVIVGGGYIAVEFACIFQNLGVQVSLSYRRDLFLRGFDREIREQLKTALEYKGVELLFNHQLTSVERNESGELEYSDNNGNKTQTDAILFATGRAANTMGLGLENAGVHCDEVTGAILVDEHYRTNQDTVFALGDIIGRVQLTPVALAEGTYLANYLFAEQKPRPVNYANIPTAVFTQPEIATVGLTEDQALEAGHEVKIFTSQFRPMKYTLGDQGTKTLIKLIVDQQTDVVIGAHMIGPEAGEIIQGVAIAVNMGATKAQFDQTIGIHPTMAEEFVTLRG